MGTYRGNPHRQALAYGCRAPEFYPDCATARYKRLAAAVTHIETCLEAPELEDEATMGLDDGLDWPVHPTTSLLAHARLLSGALPGA